MQGVERNTQCKLNVTRMKRTKSAENNMRCMFKLGASHFATDVVQMLKRSTVVNERNMHCMQMIPPNKGDADMRYYLDSKMHVDIICISMQLWQGNDVHSVLFEALRNTISNTIKSILQQKRLLNVNVVMRFVSRVRLAPFLVVVAKCNYRFASIHRNSFNLCFPMKHVRKDTSGSTVLLFRWHLCRQMFICVLHKVPRPADHINFASPELFTTAWAMDFQGQ